MSGKKANNNLDPVLLMTVSGLCSWARVQNPFLTLSLIGTRIMLHYETLVIHPAFYLIFDILPRDPLRSYKLLNRTAPSELVGDFISLYPSMSTDTIQSHSVLDSDIIQHLLTLSYQWRCFASIKSFLSKPRG